MFSTSSSECECDPYWENCDPGYNTNYRQAYGANPYYPTMCNPYVYYTQAPPPRNIIRCGRDRQRGSPNCFVKAFRWYTKEHVPNTSETPIKPDMTGFATWLDVKYDQFLQDNRLGSEMYHVKLRQTLEAERVPNNNTCEKTTAEKQFPIQSSTCEPCAAKRFPMQSNTCEPRAAKRFHVPSSTCEPCASKKHPVQSSTCEPSAPKSLLMQSLWKKKRRSKSNDVGEARQKSNQSCRYIMQPKDLSRVPSECCKPSNVTGLECGNKSIVKSQSFSNITLIMKGNDPCNATPACDVGDTKATISVCDSCKKGGSKQTVGKVEAPTKRKVAKCDFGCQFDTKVAKIDVETQYDAAVAEKNVGASLPPSETGRKECKCECSCTEKQTQLQTNGADFENTVNQPSTVYRTDYSPLQCGCKCAEKQTLPPTKRADYENSLHQPSTVSKTDYGHVQCECTPPKPRKSSSKVPMNSSRHSHKKPKTKCCKNIECQYPEEKVVNVNAQTQCTPRSSTYFDNNNCECEFKVCFRDLCEITKLPCNMYQYRAFKCPCAPAPVKEKTKKK